MIGTTIAIALRGLGGALPALVLCAAPALAQFSFPFSAPTPPSAVPSPAPNTSSAAGMAGRNQACLRLESQLAAIDRGAGIDPARAEQIKRYEETVAKQQAELDRLGQQSQRLGCQGGGFFALFSGQSPQCGPLNNQMQQMRANLDRSLSDIQRLQGNPGEDVARAVSISGRLYTELPAAFSYRKQLNPACNCRLPGQSWAEALRQTSDQTIERGDIVVTEERAKQLSQPRFDPQGKPVNSSQTSARAKGADGVNNAPLPPAATEQQPTAPAEEKIEQEPGKRKVRAVGPTFYPVR